MYRDSMRSQTYIRTWAHCEYEIGYRIFDRFDRYMDVYLVNYFALDNWGASHSLLDEERLRPSTFAAANHHRYAPRGHFRPWARLSLPEPILVF